MKSGKLLQSIKQSPSRIAWVSMIVAAGFGYGIWQNNDLSVTRIAYENAKLTSSFSGFTIAQISDLHGKEFGRNQKRLLALLQKERPDIIVLTGDFIDDMHREIDATHSLVKGAVQIAPVFWVPGNHEASLPASYHKLRICLELCGVTILENAGTTLTRGEQTIRILGIVDPLFETGKRFRDGAVVVKESIHRALNGEIPAEDEFVMLLSHRPEHFVSYIESGMDLIFTGHAHGGQWRFLGQGVYAPDQGILPHYTAGAYHESGSTMVVSRGLGNVFPLRIANRPDLVMVTCGHG